jgi:hypothetical protein
MYYGDIEELSTDERREREEERIKAAKNWKNIRNTQY